VANIYIDLGEIGCGGMDWIDLSRDKVPAEGCFGNGNEPAGSTSCLGVFEYLHKWQALEECSAPWSLLHQNTALRTTFTHPFEDEAKLICPTVQHNLQSIPEESDIFIFWKCLPVEKHQNLGEKAAVHQREPGNTFVKKKTLVPNVPKNIGGYTKIPRGFFP
jgi:hypothetical protein